MVSFWKRATGRKVDLKTDDLSPDDIIIAVVGPTGSGKSTFINIITGLETGVGHSLEPFTSEVSAFRRSMPELACGDLVFVDTPGFDSIPGRSDADILNMVANWLKSKCRKDILLSGLLYFYKISDKRIAAKNWKPEGGMPSNNLRMFKELCGEDPCHKVILATTMWDMVHEAAGEAREQEFKLKYWKTMLVGGSTTSRFLRTRESAFTLIDPLISATKKRSSVLLQQEMVDRHKKHPATSAGHVLSKMELPVRQREELPNRIRNQMKRADGDKVALEEHEELKVNLESKVDGKQRLKLPLGRCFAKMTGLSKN